MPVSAPGLGRGTAVEDAAGVVGTVVGGLNFPVQWQRIFPHEYEQ
jgi:hypothetical protein